MKKPLVSIIIASYNRAEYIGRAIDSVLTQSFKDIEIIVIDDGSTDNTKEVLKNYNIKYIYQDNAGSVKARDNGIKNAEGEYIAILDSDDYWYSSNKLKDQVEFLEAHPDYVLVGGWILRLNEIGAYKYPEKDKDIREAMLFDNMFAHSTVMYRKDACEQVGCYCSKEPANDWHLWLKLGTVGKMYNIQRILTCYSTDSQNVSQIRIRHHLELDIDMRKLYRNYYPNFCKAYILSVLSYMHSFFPCKEKMHPIVIRIKKKINEHITH